MSILSRNFARRWNKPILRATFAIAVAGLTFAYAFWVFAQAADADFNPVRVVHPFPPITEFPVKPVREVRDALNPSELVIGVKVGEESRAYPVNMLTGPQREILNDRLGGKAIAATW
jgi:hypothetical protein